MKDSSPNSVRHNLLLGTITVAMFVCAGNLHKPLLERRSPDHIHLHAGIRLENTTPLMAVSTVALGGFRGLIADVLWLRAAKLQDEGLYFENAQLADWITKLEPSFTQVWAYHSWNMAYNISAIFSAEENRLRWVRNGIRLVRDEGLVYNPNDPDLFRELGWLYQHKMGGNYDPSHLYYKRMFIEDVERILPNGRLNDTLKSLPENDVLGNMDTSRMRTLEDRYNGLDWRLPESASTYYAYSGLLASGNEGNLSCARMVYQNLRKLFIKGTLHKSDDGRFLNTPDISKLGPAMNAFTTSIDHYKEPTIEEAFFNFLSSALPLLVLYEHEEEAKQTFLIAKKVLGNEVMGETLDKFVSTYTPSSYTDIPPDEIQAIIYGYHYRAAREKIQGHHLKASTYESFGRKLMLDISQNMEPEVLQHNNIAPLPVIQFLAGQHAADSLSNKQ